MASSGKRNTRPCIKVGCLRPRWRFVSILFFSSQKQTRVRFDSAFKSPVPRREMKEVEEEAPSALPSPPSRSASSGKEPPVEQDAEQSCAQAPPQRPLVPLVSMILEGQLKTERAQVKDALLLGFIASFICVLLRCMLTENTLKRVNLDEGKTKSRHQNNGDIFKTVGIYPQQYAADWRPPFSGGESYTNPYGHASVRWDRPATSCFEVCEWSHVCAALLGSGQKITKPNGISAVQIFKGRQ